MTHPRSSASIRRRLAFSTALATGLVAALAPSTALAQVTNVGTITGTVGAPTITDSGGLTTTTVTVGGSRTIINWNDLNVSNTQTLNFVVGANTDAVLNRVLGGGSTTINGNVSSYIGAVGGTTGGQIFILNPNGVIFGGSAAVNVGGLVAGTLSLGDADFNNAGDYSFSGGTDGLLTVAAGASLTAGNGPLVLVAGQISNLGSLTSLGDIALVAASNVTMSLDPGSPVSMTIASGTTIDAALVAGGTISGRNVTMAVVGRNSVSDLLLTVSGTVTATGAALTDRGVVLTAGDNATGVIVTGSNGDIGALGAIFQTGVINSASNVEFRATAAIEGTAAINADRDVFASAPFISLGSVSADRDIILTGQIGDELTDVSLSAGGDLVLNGTVSGIDIALSAGDQLTTQSLTARDDIVIRALGSVSTGTIATGATINAELATDVAGAGDTLAAATLTGNDADLVGNGFSSIAIDASGVGSDVRINGGANGIGSGLSDLSITADGNIQLVGQAKAIDVALDAGGAITTAGIVARDDIVLRATGQILTSGLTSGTTVDALASVESVGAADALAGGAISGNDIALAGNGVLVGSVRATGAGSDVRINGGASGIGNGGFDLDLAADQDITLTSNARGRDIALDASGSITTLNLDARDDVIAVAGGNLNVGRVRTGITIDTLAAVDVAGVADTLGSAQVPAITLTGNSAYLAAGSTLDLLTPAEILTDLTLRADDFTGQGIFAHSVGSNLRVVDTDGNLTIASPISLPYGVTLETTNGDVRIDDNLTTTAGSITLTAAGGVVRIDDNNPTGGIAVTSAGAITINGTTDVRDTVRIDGATTVTFNGAIIGDGEGGPLNLVDVLTVDSGTGTLFGGTVGSANDLLALQSLTVTGGAATLQAASITTKDGISLSGLVIDRDTVLNAGNGVLEVTGSITSTTAAADLTLTARPTGNSSTEQTIRVGNIGQTGASIGDLIFSQNTRLSGNVTVGGNVQFNGDLEVAGANGDRTVTAANATFGNNNNDDIFAANSNVGLAVSVTGTAAFSDEIGTDAAPLRAFGVRSNLLTVNLLGNKVNAGVIAADVNSGDILLTASRDLSIGVVGSVSGLSTDNGRIAVTTTGAGNDLIIGGVVSATGNVDLISGASISGGAAITAGAGPAVGVQTATITAATTIDIGSVTADTIAISGGGLVETGAITANSATITGNGIRPGPITVQSSITLDGGAGGIGDEDSNLVISTPGSITLQSEAVGIDIALSSTSGNITTGVLRARDDVVIVTGGTITTGAISSGVTVNGEVAVDGPGTGAADVLRGATLAGEDISLNGNIILPGALRAVGSGSDIELLGGSGGIGASGADLNLRADGSISLPTLITALGRDIALNAGTSLTTGGLTAADDVVVRAGTNVSLGAVNASGGVDAAGAADTLAGRTLTGADADLSATGTLSYTSVTLGDDLTLRAQNVDAILLAPLPTVGGDISLTDTGGGLVITSFASTNGSLTIATENGNLSVGGVSAADNVNLSVSNGAAGQLTLTGGVTAGAGDAVSLVSSGTINQAGGVITAASLSGSSVGATTLSGLNVVASLAGFTANGLTLNVTGPLTITNAVNGGSSLSLTAGGNIAINALTETTGIMTLVSGGAITQTAAVDAAVLTGSSTGATTLANTGNTIGSIGSAATTGGFTAGGNFSLVDGGGLTIAKALSSTSGGVSVDTSGALAVNASVTGAGAGIVRLEGNGISLLNGITVSTGSGAITIDSGAGVTSGATISTGGAVTIGAVGDLALTGGSVGGTGVALNATGGAGSDILVNVAINGGTGLLAINAGGTVTSNAAGTLTTSGAGRVTVGSGGDMSLAGAIAAGSGGLALTSGGLLGLLANASAAGAGTIVLDSVGLMTLANGITLGSGSGAITLDSDAGLTSSAVISTGGAVSATADGDLQLLAGSVSGNGITLNAVGANSDVTLNAALGGGAGGVGVTAGGTIISNALGTVTATGAGAINFDSSGLMTIGGAITGGTGAVLLDSGGALTVNAAVNTGGSVTGLANGDLLVGAGITGNGIALTATGAGSDATLNAALSGGAGGVAVTAAGTIISNAAGTVTATGAGAINLDSGGLMTLGGAVSGGSGAILLDSGGALTTTAAIGTGGSVTGNANGDLAVGAAITGNGITLTATGPGSDATLNAALSGGAGGVSVTAGGTITSIAAGTVTATGAGLITLDSGGAMTVGGAVTGGTGAILLDSGGTLTTSAAVNTGGSVTGLANGDLLIGGAIGGNGVTLTASGGASTLTINAPVNAGGGTLALTGPAGIGQSAAGILTAGLLTVSSNGLVNLGTATNAITALGAVDTAGFALLDGGGLILNGAVEGDGGVSIVTSGPLTVSTAISTTNAAITLNSGTGALNLAAAVNAGTGTVDLRGATVGQTAAGIVTAGTLTGLSTGAALLDTATNAVAAIGNFSAERLALRTGGTLAITGNLTATGAASAQPGIALTANGISQGAASVVDGGAQALRFDANGGTVTLAGELRSSATGPAIAIVDAGTVSLGTVRAASGSLVLGETGASVGAVTQTGPIEVAALNAVSSGAIILANGANSVGSLGPISASALTLTDAVGGLDIAGNLRITGTLDLSVPNGAVTQSAGTIEAALLRGSSNGGATFTRAGNNIVALGPWTNANAGGLTFTSAFALSLAGDIAAGTGPLSLSALSLSGAGRTLTSGGVATLAATGGDLTVGTVTAGPSATLTATNAVTAGTVTAGAVTASGASVDIGTATASSGALALTASSGLLRLGTGTAGTTATLIKQGTTGQLEIGTRLSTQGNATVTSATNARIAEISAANGAIAVTASAGSVTGISGDTGAGARLLAGPTGSTQNLTVSATNWVRLGESRGGIISATGARLELTGAVTGTTSILFDNNGASATRLGSVADSDGFSLNQTEMDFARAPTITIQSRANPIAIGDLTLSTATGATRLNLLTSGRIDVTGRFQGGLAGRTVQLGGTTASNATGAATVSNASTVLAVSATAGGGGRLLFEGSTLDLRAAKIGVGQDGGFLGADGIGLTGTGSTPIVQSEVSRRFIGNSSSTLYRATVPYSDPALIRAGQIIVTYADYAVFQNSALAGTRAGGVTLAGSLRPMLSLNSSGATGANAFAMFAEIDGRFGLEAAVLPRTFVELNSVNPGNTRINGCLAGSAAGGCIINNVAPPLINVFDAGRADVLNAAGDLPIAFDPIVGANNESLFAGLSSIEDITADPECKPDDKGTTCPAPERTQ